MTKTKKELLENFISRSKEKFGDLFDYSKVIYESDCLPITLICKKHGEFITTPHAHLYSINGGCKGCRRDLHYQQQAFTTEAFIERAKKIWGDFYTYEKTQYVNSSTKIIVTCPLHGDFLTRPSDFLRKHGCPECKNNKTSTRNKELKSLNKEEFIRRGEILFPGLFLYDDVIYINSRTEVLLYSKLCDEYFYITPSRFLRGSFKNKYKGIQNEWVKNKETLTLEAFIQKANFIHGNKYDYSESIYVNGNTPITIRCPEHGYFTVMPFDHLTHRQGCPKCQYSKGERFILNLLQTQEYQFIPQYKIIVNGHTRLIDFCVIFPRNYIFIEYNGAQHYKPVEKFGGEEIFKAQQTRDQDIIDYCKQYNIPLLTYKYDIPFLDLKNQILNDLKPYS